MTVQRQIRQVGDTRVAIAATLKRPDGTVVDLTGFETTTYFKMLDSEGSTKVAETISHVTVTDATAGQVEYAPQAVDVDTEGTFHAYFIVLDGTDRDIFPAAKGGFEIVIEAAV